MFHTTYSDNVSHCARMLIPGTCTIRYYLARIRLLRAKYGRSEVLLDADNCIVVI